MVMRSHGPRSKTRTKLRKKPREKGMPTLTRSLQRFNEGETVSIAINPSVHAGMPHARYQGLTGKVVERRGNSFVVQVRDGGSDKLLIARPEHLRAHRS